MKSFPGIFAASLLLAAASMSSVLAQNGEIDGGATLTISGGGATITNVNTGALYGGSSNLTISRVNPLSLGVIANGFPVLGTSLWPTVFGSPTTISGGTLTTGGTLSLGLPLGGPSTILPYGGTFGLGLIKVGEGTLSLGSTSLGTITLTGTNTYTGATTISAGTLQIGNGTFGNLSGSSAVTISGAGVLARTVGSGIGFTNGLLTLNSAAFSAATLNGTGTISGVLSLLGTGVSPFIGSTAAGTLTISGLNLSGANTFALTSGESFVLNGQISTTDATLVATAGTVTGGTLQFNSSNVSGGVVQLTANTQTLTSGNQIAQLQGVPEPSTAALLALGLALPLWRARRRLMRA